MAGSSRLAWRRGAVRGHGRAQLEHRDSVDELLGLRVEAGGSGSHLLHQRRVLLCGLVHLRHGFPDLATPALCSELAALISPMMSVTRRMLVTTSFMVVPA